MRTGSAYLRQVGVRVNNISDAGNADPGLELDLVSVLSTYINETVPFGDVNVQVPYQMSRGDYAAQCGWIVAACLKCRVWGGILCHADDPGVSRIQGDFVIFYRDLIFADSGLQRTHLHLYVVRAVIGRHVHDDRIYLLTFATHIYRGVDNEVIVV